MGIRTKNRRTSGRAAITAALLLALFAGACGDDTSGSPTAGTGSGETTAAPAEPTRGGEATVLVPSDSATLDPARLSASGGADGPRGFALYGALIALDPHESEVRPVLAQSFQPDATNQSWTLELRPGIVFSDGTPFDAEAVKFNWERAQNPETRSPALGTLRAVKAMAVTGPTTLVIDLDAPNAHFDRSISRLGVNFIASPTAIRAGFDFTSDAVGAGPFLLESWLRDDRMILAANPDWKGSDGPYLDRLTLRVVPDEEQRTDTFNSGAADGFQTNVAGSVIRAQDTVDGAGYAAVETPGSPAIMFNTTAAPTDDVRVRTAIAQGVDWSALVDTVYGPDEEVLETYISPNSPWHNPDARLPRYDAAAAQRLIDEYLADTGAARLEIRLSSQQAPVQTAVVKFMQTALSQLDNIKVDVDLKDSPTLIQAVRQREYMVVTWGTPQIDPEPGLYLVTHSQSTTNYSGFASTQVDAALGAARTSSDFEARKAQYDAVYETLVQELPYLPYLNHKSGYVTTPKLQGTEIYEDGIMRWDLLWVES